MHALATTEPARFLDCAGAAYTGATYRRRASGGSDFQSPQTVLKTVFFTSAAVRRRPPQIKTAHQASADIRDRAPAFAKLAVSLAVSLAVKAVVTSHAGIGKPAHGPEPP